jgi:hypothetical protein
MKQSFAIPINQRRLLIEKGNLNIKNITIANSLDSPNS